MTACNLDTRKKTIDELLINKLRERYVGYSEQQVRQDLQSKYTETWNDEELLQEFEVHNFDGPVVNVIRKNDAKRGTVGFIDAPRIYFAFIAERAEEPGGA